MQILHYEKPLPSIASKGTLTIGMFDGFHLGHQKIFEIIKEKNKPILAITFTNHPTQIIQKKPVPQITTLSHKLHLLKSHGVDYVLLIQFNKIFAEKSYDEFLLEMHKIFPFSDLVLGKGSKFGKNQKGDENAVRDFEKKLEFSATYVSILKKENKELSSTRIREKIKSNQLLEVERLLGRPFSLYFPKSELVNNPLNEQCLPPAGSYPVVLVRKKAIKRSICHVLSQEKGIIKVDTPNIDAPFFIFWTEKVHPSILNSQSSL